jgi:hypothetical protein
MEPPREPSKAPILQGKVLECTIGHVRWARNELRCLSLNLHARAWDSEGGLRGIHLKGQGRSASN